MSALTLAVQGALAAMFVVPLVAVAEGDADVAALTKPTNFVDIGDVNVSNSSAKFGEYNGLNKSGTYPIVNFGVRGGDSYGLGEGTKRWAITGTDLGTTSRELGVRMGNQGTWSLGINYDELRHNISDTYQTPQQGNMGGNNFIIPQGFGIVDTKNPSSITNPATAGIKAPYGAQALTPTQQLYFHTVDVHSDRKNTTLTMGRQFDQQWNMKIEINHLEQSGAKLISSSSDFQNKSVGQTLGATIGNPTKEAMQMLMNPTSYKTDSLNLALNWIGDAGHFTGSYNISQFVDKYAGVGFSVPMTAQSVNSTASAPLTSASFPANGTLLGAPFAVDTLSTAPDNYFQQLNLNGGYNISQATKLVGGVSYGRNTQNAGYINQDQMQAGGLPQSSLDGLVVTKHVDLKLTNQATRDLTLTAGYKFNDRDNQTASNTYKFFDLGGATETSINTPLSNKKTQLELAGDYRIDQRQKVHLGYEYEQIHRWCNNSLTAAQIIAASGGPGGANGSTTSAAYYALGTSCVQVPNSAENKLVTNYRLKMSDEVNFNAGYSYSYRKADMNSSFYNPMQANNQGYELPGYIAFFDATRNEQLVKAGVNWQASEKFNVNLNGRYINDDYTATLGVQSGHAWGANLDGTYSFAEKSSVSAYLSLQNRQRNLLNDQWSHATTTYGTSIASGSLTQPWRNRLLEDETTVGLSAKQGELMGGKLDLSADITYSFSKSGYTTTDNWANAACTATSTSGYACGPTPDIKSELVQFKLSGGYRLDKASNIRLGYIYQNLNSTDYYYNAFQMGMTPTSLMPTNEQSPSYTVNIVTASYTINF